MKMLQSGMVSGETIQKNRNQLMAVENDIKRIQEAMADEQNTHQQLISNLLSTLGSARDLSGRRSVSEAEMVSVKDSTAMLVSNVRSGE